MLHAKEVAAEAITSKVGTNVTDTILKTANGSDFKSINDWQLKDVLTAAMQGADRPNTNSPSTAAKKSVPTWNFFS